MSAFEFEGYLSQIRDYAKLRGVRYLVFNWQGGEIFCMSTSRVLLFWEKIQETFKYENIEVHHALQTNLLGYNKDWQALIKTCFNSAVGTSLDFPNQYRQTPAISKSNYSAIWQEKKRQAEADGISISVISVPNEMTLKMGGESFFKYYSDVIEARAVQLNFPFPGNSSELDLELDDRLLIDFVNTLYDQWSVNPKLLPVSPFAIFHSRIVDGKGRIPCIFAKNCAENFFCISPNGEVGQCDAWVTGFRQFNFGNLKTESLFSILKSKNRELFLNRSYFLLANTPCGECEFWKLCYGGCPIRAYAFRGDINTPDRYCEVYKVIFQKLIVAFGTRILELSR